MTRASSRGGDKQMSSSVIHTNPEDKKKEETTHMNQAETWPTEQFQPFHPRLIHSQLEAF